MWVANWVPKHVRCRATKATEWLRKYPTEVVDKHLFIKTHRTNSDASKENPSIVGEIEKHAEELEELLREIEETESKRDRVKKKSINSANKEEAWLGCQNTGTALQ